MRGAFPIASPLCPDLPFKFVGGDPSLDLVNTADWTERRPENERLTDYERLTRWAEEVGLVPRVEAERLRQASADRPFEAEDVYFDALWLRWVLRNLYGSLATGKRPGSSWDDFNKLLAETLRWRRIAPIRSGAKVADWSWRDAEERLDSILWPVVWSAATLLTSEEAKRLRVCAGPDCGWMYVDRSRNGLRRWCQMETCGTQEKSRRRREK